LRQNFENASRKGGRVAASSRPALQKVPVEKKKAKLSDIDKLRQAL
jgi:hypothetical protein